MKISKREYLTKLTICDFERYLLEHIYKDDYKYGDSENFAFDYANRNFPTLSESDKNEFYSSILALADVILYRRHIENIFSHYRNECYQPDNKKK